MTRGYEKTIWKRSNEGQRLPECQTDRPPLNDSTSFLTSHFLSLSNARGEMWLELEFPLAGEAEQQENEREGKQEANGSRFTQAEGLLARLHVPLGPFTPSGFFTSRK